MEVQEFSLFISLVSMRIERQFIVDLTLREQLFELMRSDEELLGFC